MRHRVERSEWSSSVDDTPRHLHPGQVCTRFLKCVSIELLRNSWQIVRSLAPPVIG